MERVISDMPKEQRHTGASLERLLDEMEDKTLEEKYETIQECLDSADVSIPIIKKLLLICVFDINEHVESTLNGLNILRTLLKKIQATSCSPLPDLLPSAVEVLRKLNATALINKMAPVKMLCFEILSLYPDETLIALVEDQCNEFFELFNVYCYQGTLPEIRIQPICLVTKLLKILPPDKKSKFVEQGLNTWFSRLIPLVILQYSTSTYTTHQTVIETLENLTEEIVKFDYSDNESWSNVLTCICTLQKYPQVMKFLLCQRNEAWYRLWIVFVKLLKDQMTKNFSHDKSPINAILPIVEVAFRMDVPNRCRAYKCWNILVEKFSSERNAAFLNKKIRLLLVPILSNNARVEEVVLAKLKTWTFILKCFHTKLNNFSETILLPFLKFCFGDPLSDEALLIPGLLTNVTKTECVKFFISIVGNNAENPKLTEIVLNPKVIVSQNIWIHSFASALRICIENDFEQEDIEILWKAFIKTISELPEDNIRREMFYEVIEILEKLPTDGERDIEVIINILIPTLFENNEKIRSLLNTDNDDDSPVSKILAILLKLLISDSRLNVEKLRNMTNYLVEDAFKTSSCTIECLLKDLSSNHISIWIALSKSICELRYSSCSRMLSKMLLWPSIYIDAFVLNSEAMSSWIELYKFLHPLLNTSTLSTVILNTVTALNRTKYSQKLMFDITADIIQQKLESSEVTDFEKEAQLLNETVINLNETDFNVILPKLSDIIVPICSSVTKAVNEKTAKTTVLMAADILKKSLCQESSIDVPFIVKNLKKIFESLETIFKIEKYSDLKLLLVDDLKNIRHLTKVDVNFNKITEAIHKSSNKNDFFSELIKTVENDAHDNNNRTQRSKQAKFNAPIKIVPKRNKKKDTNIVNTVVENGEEFVIVKSNWKFNPRKLTDNQKEKLQRKREDIPALYQDLSQSQDEFRLTTWQSDSMDASNGSKTASIQGNEDAQTILKNIPNTEFLPKMLENIIDNKKDSETKNDSENDAVKSKNNDKLAKFTYRGAKSPRLSLKDRVFRNVRNLIEKSNVSENKNTANIMESVSKTPSLTKPELTKNVANSAPSEINADRPTSPNEIPGMFVDKQITSFNSSSFSSDQSSSESDGKLTDSPIEVGDAATDNIVTDNINLNDNDVEKINENPAENGAKEITKQNVDNVFDRDKREEKEVEAIEITDTCEDNNMDSEEHPVTENPNTGKEIEETPSQTSDTEMTTPKATDKNKPTDGPKSSNKKKKRKPRIENQLAINMVEGHPFLKVQSEKRLTRKAIAQLNHSQKLNKTESEPKSAKKVDKNKDLNDSIKETQNTLDIIETQDVIESSQESTLSTVSVKVVKINTTKLPVVLLENICAKALSENILSDTNIPEDVTEDIELPRNRTNENLIHLTENMDTLPLENSSEDIVAINDESIMEGNNNKTVIIETQTTAEADTESLDPYIFRGFSNEELQPNHTENNKSSSNQDMDVDVTNASTVATPDVITRTMTDSMLVDVRTDEACSSFEDEAQRKKDFLNNTLEISPIKTLSPCRDKKTPSPETSSDYVVVKLSSPVNVNGEPYNNCESPEIFTEDRESLDNRDQSPPREETNTTNSSPKSSLSLKKNKPQVRQSGRGAQMLGLCVPDRIQTIITSEKPADIEVTKKSPSLNSTARRNLRKLYSSNGDCNDGSELGRDSEESTTFLKFKRSLPPVNSSPAVPILKRKLAEINDETTASPASKRKRVSFHDPPVSTTMCVDKYIEPCGVRSPHNSAIKRQERQLRAQMDARSPKRLDNVIKLHSVLTKTVESFNINSDVTEYTETEITSPDETPVLEDIKTSDLYDTDPISLELVNCQDPFKNIAEELSLPTIKALNFEGNVTEIGEPAEVATSINESLVPEVSFNSAEMQTDKQEFNLNSTQTDNIETSHCSSQTNETGFKTFTEIVINCLKESLDFPINICENLDETAKQKIAENLTLIMTKVSSNNNDFLDRIIDEKSLLSSNNGGKNDKKLSVVQDYLCKFFETKELILFCINLLRKVHEKPL